MTLRPIAVPGRSPGQARADDGNRVVAVPVLRWNRAATVPLHGSANAACLGRTEIRAPGGARSLVPLLATYALEQRHLARERAPMRANVLNAAKPHAHVGVHEHPVTGARGHAGHGLNLRIELDTMPGPFRAQVLSIGGNRSCSRYQQGDTLSERFTAHREWQRGASPPCRTPDGLVRRGGSFLVLWRLRLSQRFQHRLRKCLCLTRG